MKKAISKVLDRRPVIVAIAGPNGAGKSTFFEAFIQPAGLRFVNADVIARKLNLGPYAAADAANRIREEFVARGESFVFETVLSDPVGDKISFLRRAAGRGFTVMLSFIGLDSAVTSGERVAMRVSQGGHDVPTDKLNARYPRTLVNLARAIRYIPYVFVYDNSDLLNAFHPVAQYQDGVLCECDDPLPGWLAIL